MPPAVYFIGRALLVALVGALATVAINKFDKYKQEKNDDQNHHHPCWDEYDHW